METPDRRRFLAGAAVATVGILAGCTGATDPGEVGAGDMDDELPPPIRGEPDADVTLTVFEDFGCPACQVFATEIAPGLVEEYVEPGDVRQVHRDFPIPASEQWSGPVANAARSVQETDGDEAFWAFAERIYEYQGSFSLELIEDVAGETGADAATARTAAEERAYSQRIAADVDLGSRLGVEGTPTVFVDGQQLDTVQPEAIRDAIDERL